MRVDRRPPAPNAPASTAGTETTDWAGTEAPDRATATESVLSEANPVRS